MRSVFIVLVALGVGACASDPAPPAEGCGVSADCTPGSVCLDGECTELCAPGDCPAGSECVDNICVACAGDSCAPPLITDARGTGPIDPDPTHGERYIEETIFLEGERLADARFTLLAQGGLSTIDLEVCDVTANGVEVQLPDTLEAGEYTLTATNQAGSCSRELLLLQGAPGSLDASGSLIVGAISDALLADPLLTLPGTLKAAVVRTLEARADGSTASGSEISVDGTPGVLSSGAGLYAFAVAADGSPIPVSSQYLASTAGSPSAFASTVASLTSADTLIVATAGDARGLVGATEVLNALATIGAGELAAQYASGPVDGAYAAAGQPGSTNALERLSRSAPAVLTTLSYDGALLTADASIFDALACADGDILGRAGGLWACLADEGIQSEVDPTVNELAQAVLACGDGEVPQFSGGSWGCGVLAATSLSCTGCVGPSQVSFNYAGSATKGGPANDLACTNCVASAEVQFNYAAAATKGGGATDVACVNCISSAEIENNGVSSADVGFTYAGSASKGGPATSAAALSCAGCIGSGEIGAGAVGTSELEDGSVASGDVGFNYAGSATKGGDATGLACSGCVGSADIGSAQVTTVKLQNGAVDSTKLADTSVSSGKLQDDAVITNKIQNGAVTAAKLNVDVVGPGITGDTGNIYHISSVGTTETCSNGLTATFCASAGFEISNIDANQGTGNYCRVLPPSFPMGWRVCARSDGQTVVTCRMLCMR